MRLFFNNVFSNACYSPPDQVMAIATLSTCYNNPLVFQGVVKIRKGQAVTLMMDATNMGAVQTIIAQYSQEVGVFFCGRLPAMLACCNTHSLCRYSRRSPWPTRLGTKPCTSWLLSRRSPRCCSPACLPGPTTCHQCTCLPPCCWPPSVGSTWAPPQRRLQALGTCRDSEHVSPQVLLIVTQKATVLALEVRISSDSPEAHRPSVITPTQWDKGRLWYRTGSIGIGIYTNPSCIWTTYTQCCVVTVISINGTMKQFRLFEVDVCCLIVVS